MEKPIVNIIQEVVDNVSINTLTYLQSINSKYEGVRYDYGHPSDIVGKLVQLSNTDTNRFKKYPLIGLFLDFKQTRGQYINIASGGRLNLFIAIGTVATYTPQQRTQQSFVPIIYPIYEEFIKQLLKHPNVVKPNNGIFEHDFTDRYQWGKGGLEYYNNGQKNIFNDFIDASEITGLDVSFKDIC